MANPALKTNSSPDEILSWLQLARSENVGPATFHELLKRYQTPQKALAVLPDLARQGGLKRPLKIASFKEIEKELKDTYDFGAQILTFNDPLYPSLLKHIDSPPPVLTAKGRLQLLHAPHFAIVGARNASAMGKKMAYHFAKGLGEKGWCIASGLARGIDTSAHQGSLETGTVGVMGNGIDQIYPPENQALYAQISEKGLLLTECAFGVKPHATLFPKRNRIISGLSRCLLVVEAALKSGSLITARFGLDQGRDIFAIPGHPLDPRARGCNQLIKNGAILVETLEDIEREISPSDILKLKEETEVFSTPVSSLDLNQTRKLINENLSIVPICIDELIRECQLSASELMSVLLEMEIAGRLERFPGGKVALKQEWKNL